jgi:mannose PTS system EIIA component
MQTGARPPEARLPEWSVESARAARSAAYTFDERLMTGIVVIAHAPLATALGQCVEHVYSCEPGVTRREVRLLDVVPGENIDAALDRARALVREVDSGNGVLVLTDAFGATPGNIAAQLNDPGRVAVVAGVNLPMLLRAVCYRAGPLADLVAKAMTGGEQGIVQVASTTVQNQTKKPAGDDQQRIQDQQ